MINQELRCDWHIYGPGFFGLNIFKLSLLYQFAARYDVDVNTVQCALTPVKY